MPINGTTLIQEWCPDEDEMFWLWVLINQFISYWTISSRNKLSVSYLLHKPARAYNLLPSKLMFYETPQPGVGAVGQSKKVMAYR